MGKSSNNRRCAIKKLIGSVVVCVILSSSPVLAADAVAAKPAAAPAAQAEKPKVEIKTIFAYKKELGLTDKQEQTLKDTLNGFQTYLKEKREEMKTLSGELNAMVQKKENLKTIREKIDKVSKLQADATYKDIETSRKVEEILTAEQKAKWKTIQEDFQKELKQRIQEMQTAKEAKA